MSTSLEAQIAVAVAAAQLAAQQAQSAAATARSTVIALNQMAATALFWTGTWDANRYYAKYSVVLFDDQLYASTQDTNKGNSPDSSPSAWQAFGGAAPTPLSIGSGLQGDGSSGTPLDLSDNGKRVVGNALGAPILNSAGLNDSNETIDPIGDAGISSYVLDTPLTADRVYTLVDGTAPFGSETFTVWMVINRNFNHSLTIQRSTGNTPLLTLPPFSGGAVVILKIGASTSNLWVVDTTTYGTQI